MLLQFVFLRPLGLRLLVELIVVIAIIGVLAAILVPSMLGYVKKSKVSSANSNAKSLYDAVNTAVIELDSEGYHIDTKKTDCLKTAAYNSGKAPTTAVAAPANKATALAPDAAYLEWKVYNYFNGITKLNGGYGWRIENMAVTGTLTNDGTYTGAYPNGTTTDNAPSTSTAQIQINTAGLKYAATGSTT